MGEDCTVLMKENAEIQLAKISTVLGGNYLTLLLCAGILLVALYVSYEMVLTTVSTVRTYFSLLPVKAQAKKIKPKKTATHSDDDDAAYPDEVAAKGLASNLQDSDNSRVKASIARLKSRYADYNTAMTEYASRVQNRVADDIIDETILSRENDDFVYDRKTQSTQNTQGTQRTPITDGKPKHNTQDTEGNS